VRHEKLTVRVEAGLRRARGIVSVGGGSRWKVEAFLSDHGGSIAGGGVERSHRRIEKSRRGSKERDIWIFKGRSRCRLGGEMGGRGVDCVLEKVFNPARDWMRGREDPGQRTTAEDFHIGNSDQKIGCRELALTDPHKAQSIGLIHIPRVAPIVQYSTERVTLSFGWWSSARMSPTRICDSSANLVDP